MKNEKGVTLVELLVSVVIASIITIIIYSMIMLTANYQSVELSKTELQREANIIVASLQQAHREGDCYILDISPEEVRTISCENPSDSKIVSNSYHYEAEYEKNREEIDPLQTDVVLNRFKVIDKENDDLSVEIATVISRIKEFKSSEGEED